MADQNPTDYPIGTNAFPAFERNVENLDVAVSDRSRENFPDRKGVPRYTYHGIEQRADRLLTGQAQQFDGFMVSSADQFQRFLESSGYSGWDRQYGPGIELNAHNEGFVRCEPDGTACLFYTPRGGTPLPYTTTGIWSEESSLFVVQNGDTSLRQDLSYPTGAGNIGYGSGTVAGVLYGSIPFGPNDKKVDGSHGPFISRRWTTTEPINLFVDPSVGNDNSSGDVSSPLRTITAALQKIPQNVYHPIYIYLLDGDYGDERISLFNHYLSARGTSLSIVGHVARGGGKAHPIYTDDKPENVILGGSEHVISGLSGSEEFSFSGITFKNGWIESYDSYVNLDKCIIDGGQNPETGYKSRHAFGGHYSTLHVKNTAIKNVAAVMASTNGSTAIFENCTLENLISESSAATKGIPFSVSVGCKVIVRSSPTLLADGPNGRSQVSGELIALSEYSNGGYSVINRANPKNDESVSIVSHNRSGLTSGLGSGIALYAINHPQKPGDMEFTFGGGSSAQAVFKFLHSSSALPAADVMRLDRRGDVDVYGALGFKSNKRNVSQTLINDGDACLYTSPTTGNVFVACKKDGVIKYAKILDFQTATPL